MLGADARPQPLGERVEVGLATGRLLQQPGQHVGDRRAVAEDLSVTTGAGTHLGQEGPDGPGHRALPGAGLVTGVEAQGDQVVAEAELLAGTGRLTGVEVVLVVADRHGHVGDLAHGGVGEAAPGQRGHEVPHRRRPVQPALGHGHGGEGARERLRHRVAAVPAGRIGTRGQPVEGQAPAVDHDEPVALPPPEDLLDRRVAPAVGVDHQPGQLARVETQRGQRDAPSAPRPTVSSRAPAMRSPTSMGVSLAQATVTRAGAGRDQ